MVARWVQQKQAKQKKLRRAWAKPYSMSYNRRGDAPVPSPVFKNDKGEPTQVISLGERSKVARTLIPPHIEARFKDHNPLNSIPKMIERSPLAPKEVLLDRIENILAAVRGERAVILRRCVQSERNAGSLQHEHTFACQKLLDGRFQKLFLYMSGEINLFVERDRRGSKEILRRSIVYNSKVRAMRAFCDGRITWTEIQIEGSD